MKFKKTYAERHGDASTRTKICMIFGTGNSSGVCKYLKCFIDKYKYQSTHKHDNYYKRLKIDHNEINKIF